MLTDPRTHQVDPRKLASKKVDLDSHLPVAELKRLVEALASDAGDVSVHLSFGIDEQRIRYIRGNLAARVEVVCQRCLGTVSIDIQSEMNIGVVWDDEQAKHLPKHYDPLIVEEEFVDLVDVIEDELLLSLPFVSYHESEQCADDSRCAVEAVEKEETNQIRSDRDNPFNVLEKLKSSK